MSLKGDKYETAEECDARLSNSVVLYEGKPVYITRIQMPEGEDKNEIARVYFKPLPVNPPVKKGRFDREPVDVFEDEAPRGGKEVRKYLSSRNFDLTPFKMGYVNIRNRAVFVERRHNRQYKQGLTAGNALLYELNGKLSGDMGFNHLIASDAFTNMVDGIYPSFKEAGDLLMPNKCESVAISRNFALKIDTDLEALILFHKNIKCGLVFMGDNKLKIPPKFHFLKQEMEEARIPTE